MTEIGHLRALYGEGRPHDGRSWDPDMATDGHDGYPDRAIVPLVETLRERGIRTLQSCAGHVGIHDGFLMVDADSVSGVFGGPPFVRVSETIWPQYRYEWWWRPDDLERAMDALSRLGAA